MTHCKPSFKWEMEDFWSTALSINSKIERISSKSTKEDALTNRHKRLKTIKQLSDDQWFETSYNETFFGIYPSKCQS